MTHAGELVAAYTITFGAIGAYAAWLLAKRRAMSRVLGPERPDRAGIPGPERPDRAGIPGPERPDRAGLAGQGAEAQRRAGTTADS